MLIISFKRDAKALPALAQIGMTLTAQRPQTLMECATAKAAWDAFASLFKSKGQAFAVETRVV